MLLEVNKDISIKVDDPPKMKSHNISSLGENDARMRAKAEEAKGAHARASSNAVVPAGGSLNSAGNPADGAVDESKAQLLDGKGNSAEAPPEKDEEADNVPSNESPRLLETDPEQLDTETLLELEQKLKEEERQRKLQE